MRKKNAPSELDYFRPPPSIAFIVFYSIMVLTAAFIVISLLYMFVCIRRLERKAAGRGSRSDDDENYKLSRAVFDRAKAYSLAYVVSWGPFIISTLIYSKALRFCASLLHAALTPLVYWHAQSKLCSVP